MMGSSGLRHDVTEERWVTSMGEIIVFHKRPPRIVRPHEPSEMGQVCLFMGVRYERIVRPLEPHQAPDPQKPRGRRRA